MVPPQTGGILLFTIGASQGNSILFRVGKDLHVGDRQDRHELERPRVSGPGCCCGPAMLVYFGCSGLAASCA